MSRAVHVAGFLGVAFGLVVVLVELLKPPTNWPIAITGCVLVLGNAVFWTLNWRRMKGRPTSMGWWRRRWQMIHLRWLIRRSSLGLGTPEARRMRRLGRRMRRRVERRERREKRQS